MAGRKLKSITVLMANRYKKLFGSVTGLLETAALDVDLSLNSAEGLRLRCP